MKLVSKVAIGVVLILLGWAYWPTAESGAADGSNNALAQQHQQSSADIPSPSTSTAPNNQPALTSHSTAEAHTCPSAEQLGTSFQQMQQQRVSLTNQLIDLHIKLGIKKPVTLQALQAVGGDLEVFQFRQSAQKQNYARFDQQLRPVILDDSTVISVHAAIAKADYDQLLQFIEQQPAADRHRLFIQMDMSLLGRLIVANPQIPFSTIQQFIDAGIQPFLADLAALTALDLPLPLIDMVQQHYKGDLQQQWHDNFRPYNLTLLAAENSSAELFDYWRSLGVPTSLQPQSPNAFDLIPLPDSEQQLQQQISKVRTLLASGMLPRAADARSRWLLLLPEQESQQLSDLLQQQPELLVAKDGPDATQLLALQQLQAEFNQLLQQVAACPTAQQWPVGVAITRELPERFYLTFLKQQQESSQRMNDLSDQDVENVKQMTELIQKKDWNAVLEITEKFQGLSAEDARTDVLMLMMIFDASTNDLQQHLSNISQLSPEQAEKFSTVASPAHRELFKAVGFDLPLNAEAAKRHQQKQEMQQRIKKAEQRRAELLKQ